MILPVLLTRSAPDNARTASDLRQAGLTGIVSAPLSLVQPLAGPPIQGPVILTSANGVSGITGTGQIAWCVGDRTATAAKNAGFQARSAGGNLSDLVELLRQEPPAGPLTYLRGAMISGDLPGLLAPLGITVTEQVTYRIVDLPPSEAALSLARSGREFVAPVWSAAGARRLATALSLEHARIVAISDMAARALRAQGASMEIAAAPEQRQMVVAILAQARRDLT